ncbi:hypothetical protein K0M31_012917 [Melipona bicolor]|uniref:Uncharacterized protein n=1 Tax=Melipona bicolor TaxID=60889 RepID=A0AA40FIS2_9HYME|nr:hypothetical protein K0M31_012917 [Melipona bicolor]
MRPSLDVAGEQRVKTRRNVSEANHWKFFQRDTVDGEFWWSFIKSLQSVLKAANPLTNIGGTVAYLRHTEAGKSKLIPRTRISFSSWAGHHVPRRITSGFPCPVERRLFRSNESKSKKNDGETP